MEKPSDLFDREWEWAQLTRFATTTTPRPTLGVVRGRRRQGKTLLVQSLAEVTGGWYHLFPRGPAAEQLDDLGQQLARRAGLGGALRFSGWREALAALLSIDGVVVLDEFPELASQEPAVTSILQELLGPRARGGTRLVLCGSALRFMEGLLAGSAPLRGRAGLELVVRPFDLPTARQFWQIDDPKLAFRVWATVGGTPAYGREFVGDDHPHDLRDFDRWIVDTVLNPAVPLLREATYLLAEDPTVADVGLYHAVLAAVAAGETTTTRIGGRLGRPAGALAHPLTVLGELGYLERDDDLFHGRRTSYRITEPLLRFHHAIVRPNWAQLQRPGRAAVTWARAGDGFAPAVLGPAWEDATRWWVGEQVDRLHPGVAATVGRGTVADAAERVTHEVDVAVVAPGRRLLLLGEAKWSADLGPSALERLRRIASLLDRRGWDTSDCQYLLASGSGRTARDADLRLDLTTLYQTDH